MVKTVIDKNGNFVATFEGGEINMADPAMKDCTIVDGDGPLIKLKSKMKDDHEAARVVADAERDAEHKHLDSIEDRIKKLEELMANQ